MIVKLMIKTMLVIAYVFIVVGWIVPECISANEDYLVMLGFFLIGISIILLYVVVRYWIYTDFTKIKGEVSK